MEHSFFSTSATYTHTIYNIENINNPLFYYLLCVPQRVFHKFSSCFSILLISHSFTAFYCSVIIFPFNTISFSLKTWNPSLCVCVCNFCLNSYNYLYFFKLSLFFSLWSFFFLLLFIFSHAFSRPPRTPSLPTTATAVIYGAN